MQYLHFNHIIFSELFNFYFDFKDNKEVKEKALEKFKRFNPKIIDFNINSNKNSITFEIYGGTMYCLPLVDENYVNSTKELFKFIEELDNIKNDCKKNILPEDIIKYVLRCAKANLIPSFGELFKENHIFFGNHKASCDRLESFADLLIKENNNSESFIKIKNSFFDYCSVNLSLNDNFILKFKDYLNMKYIWQYQHLSKETIESLAEKLLKNINISISYHIYKKQKLGNYRSYPKDMLAYDANYLKYLRGIDA